MKTTKLLFITILLGVAFGSKAQITELPNGHVGIGATNPLEKFQISNSYTFHNGGHKVIGFLQASGGIDLDDSKFSAEIRFNPGNGNFRIGTSNSETTSPVSHLTINKNGNIGIGTTNPNAKLDVRGDINTTGKLTLDGQYINLNTPVTTGNWARGFFNVASDKTSRIGGVGLFGSADQADYYYVAHGGSPWNSGLGLYVKTNGNVGIGTTTPGSNKLGIVAEAISFEKFINLKTSDAPDDYFSINNATGEDGQFIPNVVGKHASDNRSALYLSGYIEQANDQGDHPIMTFDSRIEGQPAQNRPLFGWDTHGERKMILTADGSLGIGTTNPSGKLEILKSADLSNSITLPNSGLVIRADDDGSDASLRFGVDNTNLKAVIQTQQTTTAAKFDLLFNPFGGDVGIGTTDTKGYKLAVAGNVIAEEVKVELQTNWPDYVFEESYELPSLEETEKYIKQKGHLKDIPTAQEVQENGIDLGKMDAKLLQKIEELTLYTIQQEKKINELEGVNEKLLELQVRLEQVESKK